MACPLMLYTINGILINSQGKIRQDVSPLDDMYIYIYLSIDTYVIDIVIYLVHIVYLCIYIPYFIVRILHTMCIYIYIFYIKCCHMCLYIWYVPYIP